MTQAVLETTINDLKAIFEAEKSLLVNGRVNEAASLTAPKREAMEAFDHALAQAKESGIANAYRAQIEHIMQLASETAALLQASSNGIKSIVARLRGMNSGAYVGSYSIDGRATPFSQATGSYVRKV